MNIWVIGRSYPQKINNMQGSFELEQAKMLAKHGHKVTYIACVFHPFKKVKKWGLCHWVEDGMEIYTYSQIFTIERMKVHFEPFKSMIWKQFLNKVEAHTGVPDVIHVHYPANITVAKDILKYHDKSSKIICTEHWTQVLKHTIDKYEKKQLKLYADHADAFLCVGPPLRDAVKNITKTSRDIFVVPNIVNELFVPSNLKKDEFWFVAVGVLFPHKQFDKIIIAFANRFKNNSNVKLKIIGGGPEEDRLKKLCLEYGVEDQVTLVGKLSREETAQEVSVSNCLICYSNCETFGVPIIEGWACGLPVIATTAAAVRDGWDDKLGIEVSPFDLSALEEAMKSVYENKKNYDSEYIAKFAYSHFSEDIIYQALMKFYQVKG